MYFRTYASAVLQTTNTSEGCTPNRLEIHLSPEQNKAVTENK